MRYALLEDIPLEFKIGNGLLEIVEIDLTFEVFLNCSVYSLPPENGGDKYPQSISKVDRE